MNHYVQAVTVRRNRGRTVHTVVCSCNARFDSIVSEGMARSYHSGHRKLERSNR